VLLRKCREAVKGVGVEASERRLAADVPGFGLALSVGAEAEAGVGRRNAMPLGQLRVLRQWEVEISLSVTQYSIDGMRG
jgi:hypothetical protein